MNSVSLTDCELDTVVGGRMNLQTDSDQINRTAGGGGGGGVIPNGSDWNTNNLLYGIAGAIVGGLAFGPISTIF